MSLAVLANHMASKGRNGDSMLVHMSPDEVRALQALAERHGKTLTINPETGQPEAFSLKSLLPVIAGVALGPAGFGLMSAGMAGLTVGGVTALATGDISRGLMAGLGAYGGAGLGEALMGAGAGAAQQAAMSSLTPEQIAATMNETGLTQQGVLNQAAADAATNFAKSGATSQMGAGLEALTKSPEAFGQFAKDNWKTLAAATVPPMLASEGVKTTTPRPTDTGYIRQKKFNPYTQQYVDLEPVKASEWGSRRFSDYADGGIVALADGGGLSDAQAQEAQSWFAANPNATYEQALAAGSSAGYSPTDVAAAWSQFAPQTAVGPTAQDIQSAYKAGDYGTAQQLGNILDWAPQDYISGLGLNRAEAQNLANAVGYKGDLSGLDFSSQISPLAYGFYGGVTDIGTANAANRVSATDLAQWMKDTGYTQQDIDKAFASNPSFAKAGATPEQLSKLGISPTLSRASQWQIAHGGSFTPVDQSIDNWIKNNAALIASNPSAARAKGAADAAASGVNEFDVYMATGKTLDQIFADKIQQKTGIGGGGGGIGGGATAGWTATTPATYAPPGTRNPYGNGVTPGDLTYNPDGTVTVQPNIPGRPYGGFTGIQQLKDAYTAGGGSLGPSNLFVPKTVDEMYARYGNTGGSQQAYQYLMGKGAASIQKPATRTGELMLPYAQSVLGMPYPTARKSTQKYIFDPKTRSYVLNPDYVDPLVAAEEKKKADEAAAAKAGTTTYGSGGGDSGSGAAAAADAASGEGGGNAGSDGSAADGTGDGGPGGVGAWAYGGRVRRMALGGLGALAGGGQAGYNLGSYSDGGRLLKGPGDGVSDSIPATIGNKQPARLADGEFVVPARIVSELGNGSTDAGARKLYAMMDRVQRARGKTTGKGKVAKDTSADKYLPA